MPLPVSKNDREMRKFVADASDNTAVRVVVTSGDNSSPESGTDAVGADTYATILTPSTVFEHILISNEGANPATVSLDAGTTDHFIRIPGGAVEAFDDIEIPATAIQGKNGSAGNNYADLSITVW